MPSRTPNRGTLAFSSYAKYPNKPLTLVYYDDCVHTLTQLPNDYAELVFADPPFNIGYDYSGEYQDDLDDYDYYSWTHDWIRACVRVLSPTGSMYVASHLKHQAAIVDLLKSSGLYWRDTIAWHYTFGPSQSGKFTPSWVPIHYFTKCAESWIWNGDAIKIPSARQLKYKDKRARPGGKTPDNVWVLHPDQYSDCFSADENTWLESRVCGTFKERTPHPCQMPESVLSRIIEVSSNPSGVVLDPFAGSGTTCAVAVRLGRQSIGIESSWQYIDRAIIPRLNKVLSNT